jgi:hypothetical protein
VSGEGAEDLCCIVHVVFVSYPQEHKKGQIEILGMTTNLSYLLTLNASSGALRRNAVHCPETRKSVVRKAWAMFSGRTNYTQNASVLATRIGCAKGVNLIKLIAQVYRVDVIALQVGEHNNLHAGTGPQRVVERSYQTKTHEEHHGEQ